MLRLLPQQEINYLETISLVVVRLHAFFQSFSSTYELISNTHDLIILVQSENSTDAGNYITVLCIYWVLQILIIGLITYSFYSQDLRLAQPIEILTLIRLTMPLFDMYQSIQNLTAV